MFSKSFVASILVLALGLQVQGHAIIQSLDDKSAPARGNVQKPTGAKPCGNDNISKIMSATPAKANGNSVTVNVHNFNAGQDGSRDITAVGVDPTGTGSFKDTAQVTKNGDKAPTDVSTQQVTFTMPAGVQCTAGSDKKSCLVSFKTAGGFGNCLAVSTAGGAATGAKTATGTKGANGAKAAIGAKGKKGARNVLVFTESMKAKRDYMRRLKA